MDTGLIDKMFTEHSSVLVTFTKKNGERREMLCTTKLELVPAAAHPKGNGRETSPEVKNVWDIQKQGWRSFRYDSVIDFKAVTA